AHPRCESPPPQWRSPPPLPAPPAELVPVYSQLIEADIPEVLTRRLVRYIAEHLEPDQIDDDEAIRAALCQAVAQCIPVAPPISPVAGARRVVALLGPTRAATTPTL